MRTKHIFVAFCLLCLSIPRMASQGRQPYPNAITNDSVFPETPMAPPLKNVPFSDPDFGSKMVRATDETTNYLFPGTSLSTDGSGKQNFWSVDSSKFYVMGYGGRDFAFSFDPNSLQISSLPNATPGQGLLLPLAPGATFSFVDPDLMYGTTRKNPLSIVDYRFSTNSISTVIDTTTCGMQPALKSGPGVWSDDDVSLSLDDSRVSISEGGAASGKHMFVVVYDKNLGCRWYNTQTGQIGGQWGETGLASVTSPYLVRHAYLSRHGNYVVILVNWVGWYVWDLATVNITTCAIGSGQACGGYLGIGYDSVVNNAGILGDMQIVKRPLSNLAATSELVSPVAFEWEIAQHFTWQNVNQYDSTPVCISTFVYDGGWTITRAYEDEIFCVETDGVAQTIWRFAHDRATYVEPYFQTQPLGSVSQDGKFFAFQSDWNLQVGNSSLGEPRADVWIVQLEGNR